MTIYRFERENQNDTGTVPTEEVPRGVAQSDNAITDGGGAGEPMDVGVAGAGEGVAGGGRVSGGVGVAVGAGDRGGSERGSIPASVELGEAGSDRIEGVPSDAVAHQLPKGTGLK